CRIALGGVGINIFGLLDTGAGGTVFIHPRLYQVHSQKGIPVAGHNNQPTGVVNQFFSANLVIDGHRTATWFIFCNTGRHDLIIGRKWIESTRTMLDPTNRRIVWPEDAKIDAKRDIVIPSTAFAKPTINPTLGPASAPLVTGTISLAPDNAAQQATPATPTAAVGSAREKLEAPIQDWAPYKLVDYILQVNRSIDAL
ncbi:hypothetical protein K469DRAFT_708703, partial [Zopfia rhizophila CBS 207.26]